jgi:hypothetical protein
MTELRFPPLTSNFSLPLALSETAVARFWNRVPNRPDAGCWEWTGATNSEGYGRLMVARRTRMAHRVSWELHNGPIEPGWLVCHHCDNPRCVRPDHLFLGSFGDNLRDMFRKGRDRGFQRRRQGTDAWNHKLNDDAVRIMRVMRVGGQSYRTIGKRFGVDGATARYAVTGKQWRHVQ